MIDKNILYLKKINQLTLIKNIGFDEIVLKDKFVDIINSCLLKDLTTLKGRLDATIKKYNIHKNVPIYITEDIILIQTHNKKENDNIYINVCNTIDILKDNNNNTIIIFVDKSLLRVNKPYHLIKKYYDLSLKIGK